MPSRVRRSPLALWVFYPGQGFCGFQDQPGERSVQSELRAALARVGVLSAPLPSSRTDRGVHARMQVVSLRVPDPPGSSALEADLRSVLPADLGLLALRPAPGFHARWSAIGKEYRYRLVLGGSAPAGWEPGCWRVGDNPRLAGREVSPGRLRLLVEAMVGTRDFVAFHHPSSVQRERTVQSARLVHLGGELWEIRLRGEAFARYQVRLLVGAAVAAAAGELEEEAFHAALRSGARFAGLRAPAKGLILWEVCYPPGADPFAALRGAPPGLFHSPPFLEGALAPPADQAR